VHTYSKAIESLDAGRLPEWAESKICPEAAEYYGLNADTATMRDLLLSVRADEACHRSVNHHFSDIPSFYKVEAEYIYVSDDGFKDNELKKIEQISNETSDSENEQIFENLKEKVHN